MSSNVSISNLAIAAMGHKAFIQSMDEASVEARYAKLFFDQVREATLRAHPWNFATGRTTLASLGTGPGNWAYTYALPANCLKARYIVPLDPSVKEPFEVALSTDGNSRVLHTNRQNAVLVYTHNVNNPSLFDSLFTQTFVFNLAAHLSPTLAPPRAQEMLTKYINALRQAQAVDAGEGVPEDVEETVWLEARVSGVTVYTREVEQ